MGHKYIKYCQKSNARLELLRRVASFSPPIEDLKMVYFLFIRSLLEQSATVWHSSLTEENSNDLERVQKSAVRIILGDSYKGYKKSLNILQIESLKDRREQLCLNFAKKCIKNSKVHQMLTRKPDKFRVTHANTTRFKNSAIIHMQNLLNRNERQEI